MVSNSIMQGFRIRSFAPPSSELAQTGASPKEPTSDEPRVVKIMVGSCTFVHHKWGPCDCTTGSTITSSDQNGNCKTCGHGMQVHRSYGQHYPSVSPTEPLSSDTCPRSDTVIKLVELLDEVGVVHIRGTPASGKTVLAKLLRKHFAENGKPFVFMTGWPNTSDPEKLMAEKCEEAGIEDTNEMNLYEREVTFIIDEAQDTYRDTNIWLTFFKGQSNRKYGPRICLFSSYGSPLTGLTTASFGTPLRFGPRQGISIMRPQMEDAPDLQLFYNVEELKDAIQRCCSLTGSTFTMDSDARDYIYYMTNGHPGSVTALVYYVEHKYHSDLKKGNISCITNDHVLRLLDDEQSVFRSFENTNVYRSFPTLKELTVPAADTLRRVLQERVIPCDLEQPGVDHCYKMGWLHSDIPNERALNKSEVVCFFPSPLHRKFAEHFLNVHYPKPFPFERFPSITSLCEAILRRFSRKNLVMGSRTLSNEPTLLYPPKALFQDELYHALYGE